MGTELATLLAAGVPLGSVRAARVVIPEAHELAAALDAVEARLAADERVAVAAWLAAFAHHWPSRFEAVLGPSGPARLAAAQRAVTDRNRYLKLRRIAVENLASMGLAQDAGQGPVDHVTGSR